jgi:SAM-dependent methyltransferase
VPAAEPSPFFGAHAAALREAARLGPVLDLACGEGRHVRAAAALCRALCVGVDRRREALAALLRAPGSVRGPGRLAAVCTDLESGRGTPLAPASCGALLVFRYLWRPLAAELAGLLRPGGLLLYETFTEHQRELPHGPGNPDFLLREGELPGLFPGLRVIEHREGPRVDAEGRAWHLASLAARRPADP